MNQKYIGTILIIVAIIAGVGTFMFKVQEDSYIDSFIEEKNSCYLDDGTCLHDDRNWTPYIIGGAISLTLLILGIILMLDKSEKNLKENTEKLSSIMKQNKEEEKFKSFLKGFSEDEQKVLEAVHAQDGIKQSTIRFKTGLSKTGVSLVLKDLENKKIISRKKSGKTFEVYLQKY